MSKLLHSIFIASLLAACATAPAAADPKPLPPPVAERKPPPPAPTPVPTPVPTKPDTKARCAPTGAAIFAEVKMTRSGPPMTTNAIYENGAWRHEERDAKDAVTKLVENECIGDRELASAKAALKDAAWTVTTDRITCKAMSTAVTIYNVGGKEVFRDTLCSGKHLDDKSAKALEALKEIVKGPTAAM